MIRRTILSHERCTILVQSSYIDQKTTGISNIGCLILKTYVRNQTYSFERPNRKFQAVNPIVLIQLALLQTHTLKKRSVLYNHSVVFFTFLIESSCKLENTSFREIHTTSIFLNCLCRRVFSMPCTVPQPDQ